MANVSKDYTDISALKDLGESRGWAVIKEELAVFLQNIQDFLDDPENLVDQKYRIFLAQKKAFKVLLDLPQSLINRKESTKELKKGYNPDPY